MRKVILNSHRFSDSRPVNSTDLSGIHTRNGDSIAVHFAQPKRGEGKLTFGFAGGAEKAFVVLDLSRRKLQFHTTDWRHAQPCRVIPLPTERKKDRVLTIEKSVGEGDLVKKAYIAVLLDGKQILRVDGVNVLPELGVVLKAWELRVSRFVHRGTPSGIPEYLHLGAWQMLNVKSVPKNLASIQRGLERAGDAGVQLLVTPERSLTGLFPRNRATRNRAGIAKAERQVRRMLRKTRKAPYLVVGFPTWKSTPGYGRRLTRYNVSRVYDPDGGIVSTHAKIHSCEYNFWHGYRLQEFDVYGVPVCMHICHDGRYPEVWTLPVMFGARLVLHPTNGGLVSGSIDAFEAQARVSTTTSHAFYLRASGGGGSCIVGPQKHNNLLAVSDECRRDTASSPEIGPVAECLVHANVRIADAFGYWPVRSFRASEQIAASYLGLYKSMGGSRRE